MSGTTVRRKARKAHRCGWGSCRTIQPGEAYLIHTTFPGDDSGYATTAGHPIKIAECSDCATRYGRAELLAAP